MIEIKPEHHYLAMWFVKHDDDLPVEERVDWLCAVWKEADDYIIRYRFRYHHAESPFAKDERAWYTMTIDPSAYDNPDEAEANIIDVVNKLAQTGADHNHSHPDFIPLHCAGDQVYHHIQHQPWIHTQQLETTP